MEFPHYVSISGTTLLISHVCISGRYRKKSDTSKDDYVENVSDQKCGRVTVQRPHRPRGPLRGDGRLVEVQSHHRVSKHPLNLLENVQGELRCSFVLLLSKSMDAELTYMAKLEVARHQKVSNWNLT